MLTTTNASRYVIGILCITFIIKIILSYLIPVTGDEAYYAIWGMFPAGGGYDHTPFVGWLLYPFLLISKNPVILRLPMVLTTSCIGWVLYLFLKSHDEIKAAWASIIFMISPLSVCAVLMTTDAPVILFSFLSGVCVLQGLQKNDHLGWYGVGGICLGLAFFSKYFAVLLALGYILYFIFAAPNRKRLLGLLIILLGVWPFGLQNLYWNYTHAWANILFNLYNRNVEDHFSVLTVINYIFVLFYILTPPLFYYMIKHIKYLFKNNAVNYFILVPLLFFLILSVHKSIGLHWPLSFITFGYLWAGLYLNNAEFSNSAKFLTGFTSVHLLLILIILLMPMSMIQKLPLSEKLYTKIVYFFKHKEIRDYLNNYNQDYIFTSLDYVQADMMFYDSGKYAPTFGKGDFHGREDDLMTDFRIYDHKNFLIFYTRRPRSDEYEPYFASTEVKSFNLYGAVFYYVLGQDFNYAVYKDTILRYINQTYWQIPGWLPHKPSFFCEKYFKESGC